MPKTTKSETLPKGFTRLPSGSLRVRIRQTGHPATTRTFAIYADSGDERRRQMAEARAWAEATRRDLQAGAHVATPGPRRIKLADALRRYQSEGLKSVDDNRSTEVYRIGVILRDPIAAIPLSRLRKTDVARFRDRLVAADRRKKLEAKLAKAADPAAAARLAGAISEIERLQRDMADGGHDGTAAARITEIERSEGIAKPARTTIGNTVQLIGRALKYLGQTVEGVPDVSGVSMPSASAGRERRLREGEYELLLGVSRDVDPRMPLVVRFAIETTLRRGRVISFTLGDIREVGRGRRSIVFAKAEEGRRKRTGVPPVTRELQSIIDAATALDPAGGRATPLFGLTKDTLTQLWNRLLDRAGIDDLHFHDLRHEGTSRLFERGLSMAEVQSITGHSTVEMVDRYSHYGAALVGEKLDRGTTPDDALADIELLMRRFLALGGRLAALTELAHKIGGGEAAPPQAVYQAARKPSAAKAKKRR